MAWTFLKWIFISAWDRKNFPEKEMQLVKAHEAYHAAHPFRLATFADERLALLYSIRELVDSGVGFDEAVKLELSTRMRLKYGLGLEEIKAWLESEIKPFRRGQRRVLGAVPENY